MSFEDALHGMLGRYMTAPQWLRSLAGGAYRRLPSSVKYGNRFASYQRDAELGCNGVPRELVEARLARTLRQALTFVPHYQRYRELAEDSCDAFSRLAALPLVSKLEIKHDLHRFVSSAVPARRRLRMFTGGSTAHPMLFYLERRATRPRETAYGRTIDTALLGARPGDWTLSLRGRTVGTAIRPDGRIWLSEPIKRHLIFSSDHLEARYMRHYTDALRRFRPRLVHAFPSALYPLCRWLTENPCPEFTEGVSGVLLTSENVYGFQLELFRQVFRSPIILHYGHSERALLATSTRSSDRYHLWPLYGYAELVTSAGSSITDPGVLGEIVATGFDNAAMPFIRYRTGDLGAWSPVASDDGLIRQVMERVDGRLQEFVVCRDQRLVSVTTLGAAHFSDLAAADAIQFEQHCPGELTLRFVGARPMSSLERSAISRAIEVKTQGGCRVRIEQVDRIERTARGKQRMLLQHLSLDRYLGASVMPEVEESLLSR
jgi:phenylacetate-CoA ligase